MAEEMPKNFFYGSIVHNDSPLESQHCFQLYK